MAAPNATKENLFNAVTDYVTGTINVALADNSNDFVFDPDTHTHLADIFGGTAPDATEMSGTGYTRKTLSTKATSTDAATDEARWDADDVTWTGLNAGDIQTIIVYEATTDDATPADDPVLAVFTDDTSGTQVDNLPLTTNGGDITITWATDGIKKIS